MVKDIAFFAYSVADLPRARQFYRDTLGLKEAEVFGEHWIEFDVGRATFGIGNGTPLGFIPGKSNGAAFEVDDVEAMRKQLVASGAEASEIHDFPNCFSCFVKDPDGNTFALHQLKKKQ